MTIGRILVNNKATGSGFALATSPSGGTRVALTANHVVGSQEASVIQFVTQGRTIPVESVECDEDLDIAVLHLGEDVPKGLAVDRALEGAAWQVETQPRGNDPKLTGIISAIHRQFERGQGHETYVLQLQVNQNLDDYKGYSGSPVVLKFPSAVVGVLVEQLPSRFSGLIGQPWPATNVLYAIPIQEVLDRFALLAVNQLSLTKYNLLQSLLDHHQLFGGREMELKQLNDFVSQHVWRYMFITAQSGFGKTAMLANWVKTLLQNNQDGCYYFISRPDNLADEVSMMVSLCKQLLAFHGLSDNLPTHLVEIRELYLTLLCIPPPEGKRLIVVLDGLDEALNWTPGPSLFPHTLPEGVFVVFSAREVSDADWLANLELSRDAVVTLRLKALGTGEIAHLLEKAGGAATLQANNTKFVEALQKVSQGDPFYLHFLVKDMMDKDITEENIDQQPVGLNGYLTRWWKELNDDVVIDRQEAFELLGILAIVKGPLLAEELTDISQKLGEGALLSGELDGKLRRYLIGDPQQGYALCHPRFGEYLKTKFSSKAQQKYRKELLSYCARWREHKSRYALSYYPTHLFELGRASDLYALIDKDWMEAQAQYGTYQAFAGDVQLAIDLARSEIPPNLAQEIRASILAAHVLSHIEYIPSEALSVLAEAGLQKHAEGLADLLVDPVRRLNAYCHIAEGLSRRGDVGPARTLLDRARAVIDLVGDPGQLSALADLSRTARRIGNHELAAELRESCVAHTQRGLATLKELEKAYEELRRKYEHATWGSEEATLISNAGVDVYNEAMRAAVALVRANALDEALAVVNGIPLDWKKHMFSTLATEAAGNGDAAGVVSTANQAGWERVGAYAESAVTLIALGFRREARDLCDRALAEMDGPDVFTNDVSTRITVVRTLAKLGDMETARRVLERAATIAAALPPDEGNYETKRFALHKVAVGFAAIGEAEEAFSRAAEAVGTSNDSHLFANLFETFVELGALDHALHAFNKVKREHIAAPALARAALHLLRQGDTERAVRWANEAIQEARFAGPFSSSDLDVLKSVLATLVAHGYGEALTQFAEDLYDSTTEKEDTSSQQYQLKSVRDIVIAEAAVWLVASGNADHGRQLVDKIQYQIDRVHTLGRMEAAAIRSGQATLLSDLVERIRSGIAELEDGMFGKDLALNYVVNELAEAGDIATAEEFASLSSDGLSKTSQHEKIAVAIAKAGDPDGAMAYHGRNYGPFDLWLPEVIIDMWAPDANRDELIEWAKGLDYGEAYGFFRDKQLLSAIASLSRAGRPDDADALIEWLTKAEKRDQALVKVAEGLARQGRKGDAERAAGMITAPDQQARAAGRIWVALPARGDAARGEVEVVLGKIEQLLESQRASIYEDLAKALAQVDPALAMAPLRRSLSLTRAEGRDAYLWRLGRLAGVVGALDNGRTLWTIFTLLVDLLIWL